TPVTPVVKEDVLKRDAYYSGGTFIKCDPNRCNPYQRYCKGYGQPFCSYYSCPNLHPNSGDY
ncbi:12367_t:CDS:2, partial [Funneliformis geosporum]